jgi:two-component system, NarL family, sensor kinase
MPSSGHRGEIEHLAQERSAVRSAVRRFLVTGLVVLLVVAIPVGFVIRAVAEQIALDHVEGITQRLADYAVSPLVDDELLRQDPAALEHLRQTLDPWTDESHLVRIKMWTGDGRIVYSDQEELVGHRFELEPWAQELLRGGPGQATFEAQHELENEFEEDRGELVEVYVASTSPSGDPLIFEAYYDDDVVRGVQARVLWGVVPPFLAALAVLQLAQLIPATRLARRVQEHQAARRLALQHAVDAGELERARIARDLHDDVIQDLAGLSYALEAEEAAGTGGPVRTRTSAHAVVQGSIRTLRDITSALYSPELDADSLPAALGGLGDAVAARGVDVVVDVASRPRLSDQQATMLYRVAREALANSAKHAQADRVAVSLVQDGRRTILTVQDDGRGFELGTTAGHGHLGMRIMRDIAATAGGRIDVVSAPGAGTTVTATLEADL